MILKAYVIHGQIVLDNPKALTGWEGREVEVDLNYWRNSRTAQQNRYFYSVVIPSVREAIKETQGHNITKGQAAEFCKRAFLGVDRVANVDVSRSTTALDTKEFSEYVERISAWCWSFANIVVPPPNTI